MLEGKELILATKPFAREDRVRSWLETAVTLFLLIVCFSGAILAIPIAAQLIFSMCAGLMLVRMFMIYHDFLHRAILKNSLAAEVLFTIFGLYILAPRSIWKRSHDHHHKHNSKLYASSIGSFPIVTRANFERLSRAEQINYLFIRHPVTIAFGYVFAFIWGMTLLSLWRSPTKHWDSAVALVFHFGLGAAVAFAFGWSAFAFGFLFPSVIASAIGSYLFYAQHNFPGVTFETKDEWTYVGAAMNSSSYMKMNVVLQWITGNIGFHHIHHTNALIPFYRLPEAHAAFPEFKSAKTTSLHPRDVIACFKLKVWDTEKGQMTGTGQTTTAV